MKESKLGILAFANNGGIGIQSRRLCTMLNPTKVLVIDSSPFSKNKKQDFTFFEKWDHMITNGFPRNYDILTFIEGLTHVICIENPYNFYLVKACHERGIKVLCQTNYEFCENLDSPHLPVPDIFLMPSYWYLEEMTSKYNTIYLPPPIDPDELNVPYSQNIFKSGKRKFLHIVGTLAWKDRNGTLDLLKAIPFTKSDYEIVITSQHELPEEYKINDKRITYKIGEVKNNADLYSGFDCLILPRRYGGLSLTTNEAMMSAMPVIMPDISPNNKWLPKEWLVKATKKGEFTSRANIEYYESDVKDLANKIDTIELGLADKIIARELAYEEFSTEELLPKYKQVLGM